MKLLFAGTPEIAVPSLEALCKAGHEIEVLTNPDRPKGRGKKWIPSPVKEKALELGLPIHQPAKLDSDFIALIKQSKVDLLVCIAYGKIFRQEFLDLFPLGGINLHPSALPQFRGPSPLNAAILAGLEESAITVQRLALKMDSGDILLQEPLLIDSRETGESLTEKAGKEGAPLLVRAVEGLGNASLKADPQQEELATYCSLIKKQDGLIDWSSSAIEIDRLIRAYTPWPGAFTHWKDQVLFIRKAKLYSGESPTPSGTPGKLLGVDKGAGILVETGEGLLALEALQLQSRKNLDYSSFLNGNRDFPDSQLGV